jgi:hypothetical protein
MAGLYVYVRPSAIQSIHGWHNSFSVSVQGDEWKEQKALCGTKAPGLGKLQAAGFGQFLEIWNPVYSEAGRMICRSLLSISTNPFRHKNCVGLSRRRLSSHVCGKVMQVLQASELFMISNSK